MPFDQAETQAFAEHEKRALANIPGDEELKKMYTFSDRHEARMTALLNKTGRRVYLPVWARRTAAAAALFAAVLFGMLLTDPAVSAAVKKAFVEWRGAFTRFIFNDTETAYRSDWRFGHLPPGFGEVDPDGGYTQITDPEVRDYKEFKNAGGTKIMFYCSAREDSALTVDHGHTVYETRFIDDVEYHIFSAGSGNGRSFVLWGLDGYSFMLSAPLDAETLMEIALSLEKEE